MWAFKRLDRSYRLTLDFLKALTVTRVTHGEIKINSQRCRILRKTAISSIRINGNIKPLRKRTASVKLLEVPLYATELTAMWKWICKKGKFLNNLSHKNFYLSSQISEWPLLVIRTKFSTELHTISYFRHGTDDLYCKTAFHHCTFQFITPYFVHHCMLKQALLEEIV